MTVTVDTRNIGLRAIGVLNADTTDLENMSPAQRWGPTSAGALKFVGPVPQKIRRVAAAANFVDQVFVNKYTITLADPVVLSDYDGILYNAGGYFGGFDGRRAYESTPHVIPGAPSVTQSGAVGGQLAREYTLVYNWTDALGNLHRVGPGPITNFTPSLIDPVVIRCPIWDLTALGKVGVEVASGDVALSCDVYRRGFDTNDDGLFHLLGSVFVSPS